MRVTRMYICDNGIVQIAESGVHVDLFFALGSEYRHASETHLVRHPAFPSLVGFGSTYDEASARLRAAFHDFVEGFLEDNGLESFEATLTSDGFVLTDDDGSANGQEWQGQPPQRIAVYSLEFKRTYIRTYSDIPARKSR